MATKPQDNPVIREILRQGKNKPKRLVAAALETGRIESNFTNLPSGDADSVNWRQERASIYGGDMSIRRSVARFYKEAAGLDKGQPSYELAADVQRPAAQYRGRYKGAHGEALRLIGSSGGGSSAPAPTAAYAPAAAQTTTTGAVDNSGLRRQLVGQFLQQGGVANPNAVLTLAGSYGQAADTPGVTTTVPAQQASTSSRTSGKAPKLTKQAKAYPTAKHGDVIGTPYAGTHSLGNWQSDNAVDIAVPEGTPMVALQDGVVVKVTKHPQSAGRFAGDQVTIRGKNGNEYFYAHGVANVKAGQKIKRGQSLGTTGSANGVAHLHFGQMKGDPRQHAK